MLDRQICEQCANVKRKGGFMSFCSTVCASASVTMFSKRPPKQCPYYLEQRMKQETLWHKLKVPYEYMRYYCWRVKEFVLEGWPLISGVFVLFLLVTLVIGGLVFVIDKYYEAKKKACEKQGLVYVDESDEEDLRKEIMQLKKRIEELERKQ